MYLAQTVGQELEKTINTAGGGARLLYTAGIAFLASFGLLMLILTLLRRRLLKKENRR